jgi:hypothetical protein
MRDLVRDALHGPSVDELRLVRRFMGRTAYRRVMIDVGTRDEMTAKRFARDGWRVLSFQTELDRETQLENIGRNHEKVDRVDFLNIDVGGRELLVLQDFPWDRLPPDVVVCKFEDEKAELQGHRFHALADFLVSKGYQLLVSEWYPNTCLDTADRWRRFVPYPCQLVNLHAWGYLIAVRGSDELARLHGMAQT